MYSSNENRSVVFFELLFVEDGDKIFPTFPFESLRSLALLLYATWPPSLNSYRLLEMDMATPTPRSQPSSTLSLTSPNVTHELLPITEGEVMCPIS